jgi:hypothetical protein
MPGDSLGTKGACRGAEHRDQDPAAAPLRR